MSVLHSLRRFITTSEKPVLFAGAGVSAHAGIPNWGDYLSHIAHEVAPFDHLTGDMMKARIEVGDFPNAAQYFFTFKEIPAARRFQILTSPLQNYDSASLEPLVSLPFTSIVTTNFDRALLDAYASVTRSAPLEVNLDDPTMRNAPFNDEHYIARIHGRVEVPETMILSEQHFESLGAHASYRSFLMHIFTRRQILFVGFSFLDPAISSVFDQIDDTYGPRHHGVHLALVPDNSHPNLPAKLAKFNIEVCPYASEDLHISVWNAISELRSGRPVVPALTDEARDPFDRAKRYLATVYARNTLGVRRRPLRKAIFEGIVAEILRTHSDSFLSAGEVTDAFQEEVHLPRPTVDEIVADALSRLSDDGLCCKEEIDGPRYSWMGPEESSFEDAINTIVDGVIDRYVVREGGRDPNGVHSCVDALIRNSLLIRGWDLGAAFAAGQPPEGIDLVPIFDRTNECNCLTAFGEQDRIVHATTDLLQNPDSDQERILGELGRISFGVELALEAPHDTIMHALTLPQRIYLDTNILLPAIVPNHRFHEIYAATIGRLLEAAAQAHVNVEVVVSREFLEEVIGHRRLALQEVALMEPNVKNEIEMEVMFRGADNINVYLSGYISISPNSDDANIKFSDYLRRYAPYTTIRQLENWLEEKKFIVIDKYNLTSGDDSYSDILHAMEVAFADVAVHRRRVGALIAHDAVQLAALNRDYNLGRRSIFITADRQVREFVSNSQFSRLGNSMMSHVGLVQLVDLLIGTDLDTRTLSGMMWSSRFTTRGDQIRNFLIDRALREYDEALAMEMPQLVDEITDKIARTGEESGLNWESVEPQERARIRKHIGRFEDEFFQGMREAIERRKESNP